MQRVVVVGAAVIDVLLKSSSLKVIKGHQVPGGVAMCEVVGGKQEAEENLFTSGGGGTNVAVGLHRLGEAVKMISRIGSDDLGEVMEKQLGREAIDLSMMQKGRGKTGLSVVLVSSEGERSIVTYRGESGLIDSKEVKWDEVRKADWIQISSLGGDMTFLEDLVSFALVNGIKIGINPGKKELEQKDKLLKLLPKFDFFNVNRQEASLLLGIGFEDEKETIKKLCDLGIRTLAITDGKRGASIVVNRRWLKMDTFSVSSVDDTGAGDAFVSGVVAGILQNKKPEEFLKMGLANGSSQVTKLGAKDGLLYKQEMEKWMQKKLSFTEEWI
jgi:sugar/nucleoside kinase (ribokinase family)